MVAAMCRWRWKHPDGEPIACALRYHDLGEHRDAIGDWTLSWPSTGKYAYEEAPDDD